MKGEVQEKVGRAFRPQCRYDYSIIPEKFGQPDRVSLSQGHPMEEFQIFQE